MKTRGLGYLAAAIIVLMSAAWAWAGAPVAVSPGEVIGQNCPTFSWSLADGAVSYRIEVYEQQTTDLIAHDAMSSIARPARIREIAAPALTWTPSADECLTRGVRYVWYVQGANAEGEGQWSGGMGFHVEASALTVEQVDAVQEVMKGYLTSEAGRTALSNAGRGNVTSGATIMPSNTPDGKTGGASKVMSTPLAAVSTGGLTIGADGYIGIGESTPQFPIDARLYRGGTFARFGYGGAPLFVMAGNPQIGFNLYSDNGYRYGATWYGGYLAFNQDLTGGFSLATAPVGAVDSVASTVPRMVISNNGKVGIGTTSPTAMLDVAGDLHAGPGMTPTPIAHGFFDAAAGARQSGSSNITCSWDAGQVRYACTIAGEDYTYWAYTVNVTPTSLVVPVTNSVNNQLLVQFYNMSSTAVKPTGGFSVTVFKQ